MSTPRDIAIVGLGAIFPDAPDAATYWANLCAGHDSIGPVPPDRWLPEQFYDEDRAAPDKTYSALGGWVKDFEFDWKRFRVPPRVAAAMDEGQQWAVSAAAAALADYGYPDRPLDTRRTGVVLGAAMGGDMHLDTHVRIAFPEYADALEQVEEFRALPDELRAAILDRWRGRVGDRYPAITEDTMPGELPNIISGRVANLLDLRGPNFTCDAACASSMAAVSSAVELLADEHCDAVLTGGVDRNMHASTFVKFAKIGALSATGSRPFGADADGFVMGEGAGLVLLRRLADAERDGDRIYAVIRGVGSSSDGRGKGIVAPNPEGQQLAIRRAWEAAGLDPGTATLVEAHGTSTAVGDRAEFQSLSEVFDAAPRNGVALSSAKGNIGHLKAAAGAAGLLKATLALHHHQLPPTLNADPPNPDLPLATSAFRLVHELQPWAEPALAPRRAGVSSYGFGGTNFHLVLEEYLPSAGRGRGLLAVGAASGEALGAALEAAAEDLGDGPVTTPPDAATLSAPVRLVIDHGDRAELDARVRKARQLAGRDDPRAWRALRAQGIYRGSGRAAGKVAFLFPGQGSQYLNMGRDLARIEPIIRSTFAEADRVMTPILGHPLTDAIFVDEATEEAEAALMETAITQPAVLTMDVALSRLLEQRGFEPDVVMGHSLGEYAALVVAGVLPFAQALEATAARGREMARVSVEDKGWMAAVFAPLDEVEQVLAQVDGYAVAANINSRRQCVIGGASEAVEQAIDRFRDRGRRAQRIPVSHAFHTRIVAPASEPLREVLDRMDVRSPRLPLVANVTGDIYPTAPDAIRDLLCRQIASPVQWVKGLQTLYAQGVRTFVEVGPKRALSGFVDDVLGENVVPLFTNHPRIGEAESFNHALCGLYALGHARSQDPTSPTEETPMATDPDAMAQLLNTLLGQAQLGTAATPGPHDEACEVVITGTGLGLPGAEKPIMDPDNALRLLRGEQLIDLVPGRFRQAILDKRVTRLVKGEDGSGSFEVLTDPEDVIKLAGRPGSFDLTEEYGVPASLVEALDTSTQLAMAAGLDALREAGIPLVRTYRAASNGRQLPDRWVLPEPLRDETGVIFASTFPGLDRFADELQRYFTWCSRRDQLSTLDELRAVTTDPGTLAELARRADALREDLGREPYAFDRRFLFRVLAMGHSQFAEYIGARGPNTAVNIACASTDHAVSVAEDWIRAGRCRRVVVIAGDNVTSDRLLEWIGAGFQAAGAAATDDRVEDAALPFDRRRHGLVLGMGACALVVERADAPAERGMRGIVELVASETANSAHHATQLDADHLSRVMDLLVTAAEQRHGLHRAAMAGATVFVSHETYTPARGGSASAEVAALRHTFGPAAERVVIANTKGYTGHPMGVGIETAAAVKMLEHGIVPPVPNLREPDPDLGPLNLSRGGPYPIQFALHLAAGFGSQVAMTLFRRVAGPMDRVDEPARYERWIADVSGRDRAATEVHKRVLRVADDGAPARRPAPSTWRRGGAGRPPALARTGQAPQPQPVPMAPPLYTPVEAPQLPDRVRAPESPSMPAEAAMEPLAEEAPGTTPTPVPAESPQADRVADEVVRLVSEQTGYPADMLDLDLDLEADLGVDTVKQAETFSAICEAFGIARPEQLNLRDYPSLGDVVGFVRGHAPATDPAPGVAPEVVEEAEEVLEIAATGDPVADQVLQLVADLTGYPVDMLDLDLDLEADLGVDTVKQAETFSAIRQQFGIPRPEDLNLRDYPTLGDVVRFVRENDGAPQPDPTPPEGGNGGGRGTAAATAWSLDDADLVPRRVVTPVLRPPLELYRPTGVEIGRGDRIVVALDEGGVGDDLVAQLSDLGATPLVVAPGIDRAATAALAEGWLAQGPVSGVFWLRGLDADLPAEQLDLATWRRGLHGRVKALYGMVRALRGAAPFLVTATRMGGLHGYGEAGASAPMGGAVTGFAKAYSRELPDALVKAVDVGEAAEPGDVVGHLLDELRRDAGVVEVGWCGGQRFSISFEERPAADDHPGLDLNEDSVFVVTGAAGGITSAIVGDLAGASGGTFHLLDRTAEPRRDDFHVHLLRTGRDTLQEELIRAAREAGERPVPREIEARMLEAERRDAALRAIEAVEAVGGRAVYHSVDLLDGDATAAVLERIRTDHERIDVVLHAAGLEISRPLQDKGAEEFDLVFDVKADGLYSLLHGTRDMEVGALICFSSVAGRFGNRGQTDYSAANDLLCKMTSSLRRTRPGTRAIAIDWTAWAGIGMATRGSIPAIMEAAGIDMLPPAVGVPTVRREIVSGGFSGEIVVGDALGVLVEDRADDGGLDLEAAAARFDDLPMIGVVRRSPLHGPLEVETVLDPTAEPFLFDHQVEPGLAYLPGVMGIEAFAELASALAPDHRVDAVREVRFASPLKFHRDQPRILHLRARVLPAGDADLSAHVELCSQVRPDPQRPPRTTVHFTAEVVLTPRAAEAPVIEPDPPADGLPVAGADDIYGTYFHGPAYRVLQQVAVDSRRAWGSLAADLPPDTASGPGRWLMAPRLVELCFQAAGLWEIAHRRVLALPESVAAVRVYATPELDAGPLTAVVDARGDGESFDVKVVDAQGRVVVAVDGYRTVTIAEQPAVWPVIEPEVAGAAAEAPRGI